MYGPVSYCFNGKTEVTHYTKTWLRQSTIYPIIILWHWKSFLFRLRKYADKGLKNHYIISKKTSIT